MNRKPGLWLSIGLVLIGQACVFAGAATGIDLLTQQYHVWGYAGREPPWGSPETYNRTLVGTTPNSLDGSATGTYIDPPWDSGTVTARSSASDFHVSAYGEHWWSAGNAQALYTFTVQPGVRGLTFVLDGSGYGVGYTSETNVEFTFQDLTTGIQMVSVAAPSASDWEATQGSGWYLDWTGTYPVDPAHTYSIELRAFAGTGDTVRSAALDVNVLPIVPAPAAMALGIAGMGLVGWLRRRRTL